MIGDTINEYIFFGGARIARRDASGNVVYYFADHLGSSRVVANASGTILDDSDFYPFGGERPSASGSGNTYKFERKERDAETGNDDFGARFYVSRTGRFLSVDWSAIPAPVPYANLSNPQTLNLYAFVSDNPITFADLDGHLANSQGGEWRDLGFAAETLASCFPATSDAICSGAEGLYVDMVTNTTADVRARQKLVEQQNTAQNQSHTQTQQNPVPSAAQKVLTQVKKEFPDLSVPNGAVQDLGAHNGHENIVVNGTASKDQLAQIQKTLADNAGLFGPESRINIEIGSGTYALHVEFAQFNSSGDTGTVRFQSHIDRGNPNAGPVGLLKHVFVDGLVGAVFHHNDPGLDPQ